VVPSAIAIELTHLATLYHDDVMDEADVRRGSPSANSRWDNSVAILTGDYLFACASKILADLGPDAVRIQAETFSRLVTGQISETVGPRPARTPRDYMGVVTEMASLDRHRRAVRRDVLALRRLSPRVSPPPARHSAWPSNSPTTSLTCRVTPTSRARRREPTCARA
jgi:hypothetical protein